MTHYVIISYNKDGSRDRQYIRKTLDEATELYKKLVAQDSGNPAPTIWRYAGTKHSRVPGY